MICVPVMAENNPEALEIMKDAASLADILEIRLDVMKSFDIDEIVQASTRPLIITYRSKKEGGSGLKDYETVVEYLLWAIRAGADFVDVEYGIPLEYRQKVFQMKGKSKIIVSTHLPGKTPSEDVLEDMLKKMASTGADIVKLITLAREPADNLRILNLFGTAKNLGIKLIAFCMGHAGLMSRIFTIDMGGFLTFASLDTGKESAPGQIPVRDMKKVLDIIK